MPWTLFKGKCAGCDGTRKEGPRIGGSHQMLNQRELADMKELEGERAAESGVGARNGVGKELEPRVPIHAM